MTRSPSYNQRMGPFYSPPTPLGRFYLGGAILHAARLNLLGYTALAPLSKGRLTKFNNPEATAVEREAEKDWPAPGSEDTELGVILEPEVVYGTQTLCTRIQA